MCTLRRARHLREEWSKRHATRKTKRLKKVVSPTRETRKKTKTLPKIDSFESDRDDSDAKLFGGKNDTSHAEALNESIYSEGDE
jgi:hypothetical protein